MRHENESEILPVSLAVWKIFKICWSPYIYDLASSPDCISSYSEGSFFGVSPRGGIWFAFLFSAKLCQYLWPFPLCYWGDMSGLPMLDLSRAFDLIDHTLPLNKLEIYGWFNSYLKIRKQTLYSLTKKPQIFSIFHEVSHKGASWAPFFLSFLWMTYL